jgi:hypothetical protein
VKRKRNVTVLLGYFLALKLLFSFWYSGQVVLVSSPKYSLLRFLYLIETHFETILWILIELETHGLF